MDGGADALGTVGGACGYQDPFSFGYGQFTTAISDMIYNGGLACEACFKVKCMGDPKCYLSIVVVMARLNPTVYNDNFGTTF